MTAPKRAIQCVSII